METEMKCTKAAVTDLFLFFDAIEDTVVGTWVSCTIQTKCCHGLDTYVFRPLTRSGPRSPLKAGWSILGSSAYLSEQGQVVNSKVFVDILFCFVRD
jgi:hypothetical protein